MFKDNINYLELCHLNDIIIIWGLLWGNQNVQTMKTSVSLLSMVKPLRTVTALVDNIPKKFFFFFLFLFLAHLSSAQDELL